MRRYPIDQKERHQYDAMIYFPHPVSSVHPPMAKEARAAQFAPFAALSGYDAAVKESSRLTDRKIEMDEEYKNEIDRKLQQLLKNIQEQPWVKIEYFVPDEKKKGGAYTEISGRLKKIEWYKRKLILKDKREVPLDQLTGIAFTGENNGKDTI